MRSSMSFLQVHSHESEVCHNGLLKYQDFPNQSLPQIVLNTNSLKEHQNNFRNESGCVSAK